MNIPAVSVIMPVYNGHEHLTEALDSILAQTFSDFEFIIVDDASTDATSTILADYAQRDSRVRILTNEANSKIAVSLNRGIVGARTSLIARMDADDWAHPERLAKQYAFMQAHPEVTVCGTWLEVYDSGELWGWVEQDTAIRVSMLFNSTLAHPTVMFRKDEVLAFTGGYDVSMPPAEDYDLWARLMEYEDVRFANIASILLRYRTYPEQSRKAYYHTQHTAAQQIRRRLLTRMGLDPTAEDMFCHLALAQLQPLQNVRALWLCHAWAKVLLAANERTNIYDAQVFSHMVRGFWQELRRRTVRAMLSTLWVTYVPECVRTRYKALKKCLFAHTS